MWNKGDPLEGNEGQTDSLQKVRYDDCIREHRVEALLYRKGTVYRKRYDLCASGEVGACPTPLTGTPILFLRVGVCAQKTQT